MARTGIPGNPGAWLMTTARNRALDRLRRERTLGYAQQLEARGLLLGTNSLRNEAMRLSRRDGTAREVDGPFTEAKEFIGGYFLIDCRSLEEAQGWAEQCPAAEWATIEIREVGPCYT